MKKNPSLGGFEPPTFRLTAERASRLRHRDCYLTACFNFYFIEPLLPLEFHKKKKLTQLVIKYVV